MFNDLYNNKQIVICSDKKTADLTELEDRLRSRFQWNMVVDIKSPDYETGVAILNSKAREMNMSMDESVEKAVKLIAGHISDI